MKKLCAVGPDGGSGRGSDEIPVSNGIETKVRPQASIEHFSSRCRDQMLQHRLNGTYVLCADLCQPQRIERAKFMVNERSVERTVLPNGLTILTERMENVRSVAMGVWVRAGSRHEIAELNGISHFVEHMVFKGTESRTAQRIAREVDAIGGNLDAFTGKETICFNIKVLDEHVPPALDVLSDLVLNPVFANQAISRDPRVLLEQIKINEDNPHYLAHQLLP